MNPQEEEKFINAKRKQTAKQNLGIDLKLKELANLAAIRFPSLNMRSMKLTESHKSSNQCLQEVNSELLNVCSKPQRAY